MRIGLGYDAHAFSEGRPLYLGGLHIPHPLGLRGHSDADVLLHAISDAILGAGGLSDIGVHFPNTNKSIEGIESEKILKHVMSLVRQEGYELVNLDAVIICEEPKIQPYKNQIVQRIAQIMAVEPSRINIKGKTTEGLGFTGKREGIESYAVCLLE
jgi:2-C-methyl-D-erythritol 2,4-cyclodiphosphate synthase